jgi:hypothetical protein
MENEKVPQHGSSCKSMAYLKGKSEGDGSMPLKRIEPHGGDGPW